MIKKTKKSKVKSKNNAKRKNPITGTQSDAYDFQSARYHLANVYDDPNEEGLDLSKEYSKIESLSRALNFIAGPLKHYERDLLTPRVKAAMNQFAKLLRQQLIATSFRSGIDSFTGLKIKK